jgi:WD40 repeat protein
MRLDPKRVRFISPMLPLLFTSGLRFVGREKTVQLQETALVVEGNLLKIGLLGLELLFRRVLAEWSSVTIPYSRIYRVRYIRFPLMRRLSLFYLILWPLFSALLLLTVGVEEMWELCALAGIPGVAALFALFYVSPRHAIEFRTKSGARTRLVLQVSGKRLREEFLHKLDEYRIQAKNFAPNDSRADRTSRGLVAGIVVALVLLTSGLCYFGWQYLVPHLTRFLPGGVQQPAGNGADSPIRQRPGMRFGPNPITTPVPNTGLGNAEPFRFEPINDQANILVRELTHPKLIKSLVWLPDGRLATACDDGVIRVWELPAGRGTGYSLSAAWQPYLVALAPDPTAPAGVKAAFGSINHLSMFEWILGVDGPPRQLVGSPPFSPSGSYDPTGGKLALVSGDGVEIWDMKEHRRSARPSVKSALIGAPHFSHGGSMLVAPILLENKLLVWSGGEQPPLVVDGYSFATLSPDGKTMAASTVPEPGVVRLVDSRNGKSLRDFKHSHGTAPIAIAPGGQIVAAGYSQEKSLGIGFWDTRDGKLLGRIEGTIDPLPLSAFSPDGSFLATVGLQHVTVWRTPLAVVAAIRRGKTKHDPPEFIPPPRPVSR